jgi:AbrB family looped-hinge helix DNA binding protein
METAIVTVKGQLVVPAAIRRKFGIKKGTHVAFIEENGRLMLQPLDKGYFDSVSGILGSKGKAMKALMAEKKRERKL